MKQTKRKLRIRVPRKNCVCVRGNAVDTKSNGIWREKHGQKSEQKDAESARWSKVLKSRTKTVPMIILFLLHKFPPHSDLRFAQDLKGGTVSSQRALGVGDIYQHLENTRIWVALSCIRAHEERNAKHVSTCRD